MNTTPDESDSSRLARMGADAQLWAKEFVKLHGGDERLMLSWFAAAIETGRSAAITVNESGEVVVA